MNVVLIHELLRATAMQRFLSLIFHTRSDTEIRGMLNKTNSAVTCKVHCKHSINLTTRRKWNVPEKKNAYRKKEITSHCVGIIDVMSLEENMLGASKFISTFSCEACTVSQNIHVVFHFLETFN